MVNLELARKYLIEYLPDDAQIPVNDVLDVVKNNPMLVLHNGLVHNHMRYFSHPNKSIAECAAYGMLLGLALAKCLENPEFCAEVEQWISTQAKSRGSNVINFLEKRGLKK